MASSAAWASVPAPKPAKKAQGVPTKVAHPAKKAEDPQKNLSSALTPQSAPKTPSVAPEAAPKAANWGGETPLEKFQRESREYATRTSGGVGKGGLHTEKVDETFVEIVQGKPFVLYAGLLDLAHRMGLEYIRTTIVQVPGPSNNGLAVVQAEAKVDGRIFYGIGDADAGSVSMRTLVPHIIRIAETRAKARALRDATNVGMTAKEELGSDPSLMPYDGEDEKPKKKVKV